MQKEVKIGKKRKAKGYFERFNHLEVCITLITGEKMIGKLHTNTYNKYDVLLEFNGRRILIPKHSISYLAEVEKGE